MHGMKRPAVIQPEKRSNFGGLMRARLLPRLLQILCLSAFLGLSTTSLAQVLYLGKDSDGRTRITNVPAGPSSAPVSTEEQNRPARAGNAATPQQHPPQQVRQPQVTMYATSWCGYCAKARALFRAEGVAFVEHDIERSPEANAQHKALGGRGVPLIVIGNQTIKGYSEQRIRAALAAQRG